MGWWGLLWAYKLTTNKFGIITKTTYDEEGLLVTKTTDANTPNQKITLTSYDVKFRKPTKEVKDGLVTFYDYDENGKTIQKPSAKSLQKFTKAMLKTDATQKQVTKYQYNEKGQRTGATKPNGAITQKVNWKRPLILMEKQPPTRITQRDKEVL